MAAFPDGKLTKHFLDPLFPDRPVIVYDEALHNVGVNSVALQRAGITRDTPDPPLGVIDRDPSTGEPTGFLSETGIGLVGRHVPRVDTESLKRGTRRALNEMTAFGITAFIDMMMFPSGFAVYEQLDVAAELPFRILGALAMNEYTDEVVTAAEADEVANHLTEYSTSHVQADHFKYWADGTALSFTALLVDPYTNDPSTHGEMTMTLAMKKRAIELLGSGLGGHFHATRDGTVREVLDLIEAAREKYPGKMRRAHIGHNQIVHEDDIPRYNELNVVAEFSPPQWFPTTVSPFIPEFIGRRADRWMPIREFLDVGVPVAVGSDWPAGTPTANPWRSLQGLVTRQDPSGEREGQLGQPIDLASALRAMTLGGAIAMGSEANHGSLEVGKYADMIVLDHDLTATSLDRISQTTVLKTIFNGKVVYEV